MGTATPRSTGRRARRARRARGVRVMLVVATGVALVAVIAWAASDHKSAVDSSLARGERNPLSSAHPSATSTAPSTTVATTPPTTVPVPVPMVLPGGPAPAIARVTTTDPVIFLGIDDGLIRDPAALDFLEAHHWPFTSFLVNGALQADPAFWTRARAIGGTIEAHTVTHPNLTKVSADQIRREVCGSADAVEQATGVRPRLFRPPYGAYNDTVRAIAAECGFIALVMWKGATNDGRVDLQEGTLKAGDILLMHWRTDLLTNLQQVKALADAQGLRIARLEDYLQPLP